MYQRLHNGTEPKSGDVANYLKDHPNGIDFSFFLTDPEHPLTWTMRPGPDSSVVEILTDWNDPILEGAKEYSLDGSHVFKAKILGVDANNRLIGIIALNKQIPLVDTGNWARVIFFHPAMALQQEDVTNIEKHTVLSDIVDFSLMESLQGNPWIIPEPDN